MTDYTNTDLGTFEQIAKLENGKAFLQQVLSLLAITKSTLEKARL